MMMYKLEFDKNGILKIMQYLFYLKIANRIILLLVHILFYIFAI